MVKYGLSIYTQRRTTKADDGTEFYDGSGELNIYGLGSTSSANTLALNMNNYSVGYVASSSKNFTGLRLSGRNTRMIICLSMMSAMVKKCQCSWQRTLTADFH